jgi:allophanate hydrolase subunit 2
LDPWHRGSYDRVVRAVRELSEPVSVLTRPYGSERAVALGTVQFPSGTKPVAFIFGQLEDGTVYPLGWVMLKETV